MWNQQCPYKWLDMSIKLLQIGKAQAKKNGRLSTKRDTKCNWVRHLLV